MRAAHFRTRRTLLPAEAGLRHRQRGEGEVTEWRSPHPGEALTVQGPYGASGRLHVKEEGRL